ncbi:MAG: fluoride efflux transporter CrcB [Acidobacteriota bacterium]|jgi:CrcB protein|nr:fluoride efflux transporter CrcB [Acidobacteriota bacterium]
MQVLLVFLGGGIGAACRYAVSLAAARLYGDGFPWGTLWVNLAGCFLIGLAFALGVERAVISPQVRLLFVTGFLGGLTTFSSYGIESVSLARDAQWASGLANIAANNVGGLLLVLAGLWTGRQL